MDAYEINPMVVQHEIKSQLAKLLATEDLVVEHKKVSTACFNVHTRVLTLPLWEKASGTVYDLLVGHEVGHALFTPDEDWREKVKVPMSFINIVEDARIEKLMKRRYAGIAKTFFGGYKELNERDFFQIAGDDISKLGFADRVNLYFKIGNLIVLNFNPEEKEIIDIIASTETFDDALLAAEKLYKYCKKQKKKEKEKEDESFNQNDYLNELDQESSEDCDEDDDESSDEKNNDDENDQDEEDEDEDEESSGGKHNDEDENEDDDNEDVGEDEDEENEEDPEVRTVESFEESLLSLLGDSMESVYVEIPELNLDTVVVKNSDIHEKLDNSFRDQQKIYNEWSEEKNIVTKNIYKEPDLEFKKFKTSAQKEVNYLVKEFECRKAADQYARATTARTGVLDTSRLHTYKYNEDLFKKVSVIPDGKNHGLVFVLDWSGSMDKVMLDTCKQLFNLIWFCRKVSIPFEVYAFTNEWCYDNYDYKKKKYVAANLTPHYEKKESLLIVDETFNMMNILSSKVSNNVLNNQMLNIWRLAYSFTNPYQSNYNYPSCIQLSGTPLNESLISLHQILPKFQKENKLQKVQCIVLTDGEGAALNYHKEIPRRNIKEPFLGAGYVYSKVTFLRDRKLGTTYNIGYGNNGITEILLKNLKDNFPSINFIGIRVLENRHASKFIRIYHNPYEKEYEKIMIDWKKMRSFVITKSGYDAYIGISASSLSEESKFEVSDDAMKTEIKNAFIKSLNTKKLNKKVLGEFISLVV